MAKRIERREEMAGLLARREREGLSYRELSEQCGIPAATLSWWSHRLRAESRPAFAEVTVVDAEGSAGDSSGVLIRVDDVTVEVARDFDAAVLARVIDVVRSRC